jgi:alpha-L-fucosidase
MKPTYITNASIALLTAWLSATHAFAADRAADAKPIVGKQEIAAGAFSPTDESLSAYQCPDWFRDAKFGIWAHWGPQAVPRQGDWYARRLYLGEGQTDRKTGKPLAKADAAYNHHVKNYGHPSKFGYKDILPLWKAERLDADALLALYKKTGARYFVSMGTHHDNYFLWDSKIHRWNAVKVGPKKDVVKLFADAARKQGLKFGVSEHLGASFTWFRSSHAADKTGPMKDVPFDGADPANQDLYHKPRAADDNGWLTNNPEDQRRWFDCIKELVDNYQPDLLYSDSPMPFGDVGRSLIAHYYNSSSARNGGTTQAVYNCKEDAKGKWVRDIERGVAEGIRPEPWQTDTSIGDWYYRTGQKYMNSGEVVRMLIDIVSKNGNLLLNVVQTPEGDLEPDVLAILDGIGQWVALNGEGIYGTRPWKTYGEGPSTTGEKEKGRHGGLKDVPKKPYTQEDFRFTASKDGKTLYAFCMAAPDKDLRITSLGSDSKLLDKPVASVRFLGSDEKAGWKQEGGALVVTKPRQVPNKEALVVRIALKE